MLQTIIWITVAVLLAWFLIAFYNYWRSYVPLKKRATIQAQVVSEQAIRTWDASYLQSKRMEGDPLADEAIAHILTHGNDKAEVNKLFILLTSNDQHLPNDVHPAIKHYFEESAKLPDWANKDLIEFGHNFYLSQGILVGMLLFYKSLPECYTGAKGAEVLLKTSQLSDRSGNLDKLSSRLAITGTYIYKAMMPGALQPQSGGIIATQKIRLIHAASRFYILNRHKGTEHEWKTAFLGLPVNQEDMAGTLMAFSALVLEGLEILGVKMTVAQRESYIHCWRVLGFLMGVHPELIPINADDAIALGHAVINDQMKESHAGKTLTTALLNFCVKKAPWFVNPAFHSSMLRYLMGDQLADMVGVHSDEKNRTQKFIKFITGYVSVRETLERHLLFAFMLQLIDRFLLKFSYMYLGKVQNAEDIHFQLPKKI